MFLVVLRVMWVFLCGLLTEVLAVCATTMITISIVTFFPVSPLTNTFIVLFICLLHLVVVIVAVAVVPWEVVLVVISTTLSKLIPIAGQGGAAQESSHSP